MSELKAKFRDGLTKFFHDYYEESERNLNDIQRSVGLGLFYLTQVFGKLNPGSVPDNPEDLLPYVVDGRDDQGIDILFSQDNHHYLIQCKFRGKGKIESDKEVLEFREVFHRIHPDIGKEHKKNEKLTDLLVDIDWKNDTFELIFVSLGRSNDDIKVYEGKDFTNIDHLDLKDINFRASFRLLFEDDLNMEYRDSMSPKNLRTLKIQANCDKNKNYWFYHEGKNNLRSFITTIGASQIHSLHEQHRTALFNLNIRNFIGDTSTNKGIIKTADSEPDNFLFYNNGISAIASKINETLDNGILECENFSITNGAQTFRSISRAYARSRSRSTDEVRGLAVMLRITETPNLFTDPELAERITQYNNTQNAVKISDFRSNDGVQTSLAFYFNKISYRGKKYHYKNKRTKESPKNSIVINLDDFCKTIHSFKKGPVDCFGGIKNLYDTSPPDGGYYYLFSDPDSNSILDSLSKKQFEEFVAIFFICETTRSKITEERKARIDHEVHMRGSDDSSPTISKRALEGRYLICFVIGRILESIAKMRNQDFNKFLEIEKFKDPRWREDKKKEGLIVDSIKLGCDVLAHDYNSRIQNRDFVHRNWIREKETLKRLRTILASSSYSSLERINETYSK